MSTETLAAKICHTLVRSLKILRHFISIATMIDSGDGSYDVTVIITPPLHFCYTSPTLAVKFCYLNKNHIMCLDVVKYCTHVLKCKIIIKKYFTLNRLDTKCLRIKSTKPSWVGFNFDLKLREKNFIQMSKKYLSFRQSVSLYLFCYSRQVVQ